jgi:hypothetical protein
MFLFSFSAQTSTKFAETSASCIDDYTTCWILITTATTTAAAHFQQQLFAKQFSFDSCQAALSG